MALETLKEVTKIGGVEVKRVEWQHPVGNFIEINDAHNAITFKIQDGPVKKKGVNGCQVDQILEASRLMLEGLHKKVASKETACAITHIEEAIMWLEKRRADRTARGVEGTNNL